MKKTLKRLLSAAMATMMSISLIPAAAFANEEVLTEEPTEEIIETVWYGDKVSIEVTAGNNSYNYLSVYKTPYCAYEMSNHMVSTDGGVNNDIPQTLIMIDANQDYTWTPNGRYTFDESNYEVLYCCDAVTGYDDGIYYKRMNLEDSDYYTEEEAAHIRAIITNSYPYVSLEQMKATLAADGFEGAEDLDRAEAITAVQAAVWYFANGEDFRYSQTFNVAKNTQWGGALHDYTAEMSEAIQALGKRKFLKDEAVGNRINSLIDYLKEQDAVYAEKNQIVISAIDVLDTVPVQEKDGVYTIAIRVMLNNSGSSELDNIALDVYVGDTLVTTNAIELGTEEYYLTVEATAGDVIKAVVSGTQVLPEGVYFYEPQGGRDISQSLVGVAVGETNVYAEASVTPEIPVEIPNTFELSIKKVDENGQILNGVAFSVAYVLDDVNYLLGSYDVDENGAIAISDLLPGRYILTETKTPDAYNYLTGSIEFVVNEDGTLESTVLPEGVTIDDSNGLIEITVVNTRVVTQVTLEGSKYLDGQLADGFQFTLTGENVEQTVSTIDGVFTFDTLYFDDIGIYTYEICEVMGDRGDVVYDESVYTVVITVVRAGRELIASVEIKLADEIVDEIAFNNKTVAGTEVTLSGNKYLDGQLADGFRFALTGEGMELTADSVNGVFTFDTLYFSNAGIYTYEIREVEGDDYYVIYDEAAYTVTITVIKDGDKLVATVETKLADEIVDEIAFNNKTVTGASVTLNGYKYLDGDLADGFQFTLLGETVEQTVGSTDGMFTFDTLHFDKVGTYTFLIYEEAGEDEEIIYDASEYYVTITVIKNGDHLEAAVEIVLDEEIAPVVEFYNETEEELTPPDIPEDPTPDKDGDPIFNMMLVMLVSVALMGGCVVLKRKEA